MAVAVTKEILALLKSAFEAGVLKEKIDIHNKNCEESGEEDHKRGELTFEYWYASKIIDNTGEEDLLFTPSYD